jgi:tRNA nucleotidyltransferase/poly(A) polymerase
MGKLNNFILSLRQKSFIQSIINDFGGEVFAIGGVVRDLILNKPNKDIDLIIRKVPIDTLITHLRKFGRVNVVGKSFGVIKFIDNDGTDYDLALPRKEQPTGEGGYRGFDVQSDENLPIEDDIIRRDAKMNAMAININTGKFIDPLGGLKDIEKKQISAANPEAFSDDPLRMIRMVGFASRFGFTIEPKTMQMIQNNAGKIKEIPAERILMEFDKIVKKGNKRIGAQLLKDTGLFNKIFGFDLNQSTIDRSPFEEVKTMGEFIFLLIRLLPNPSGYYKNNLKGDTNTYKEIKALEMAFDSAEAINKIEAIAIAHNMYITSPQSLESKILPNVIEVAVKELLQGKYPKGIGDLVVNGNDLIKLGLKGEQIGNTLKMMLLKVYSGKIRNNKEELLSLIGQKLDEEVVPSIDFFIDRYDQWNAGGRFSDPSKESVLRFLEDEFPDMVNDENLKNELRWKLTDREVLNENDEKIMTTSNISYSAVVLDKVSRKNLIKVFKSMIPEGWEIIADHMTIKINELNPDSNEKQDLFGNKTIELNVIDYAINDMVMAVGVNGYVSESLKSHITLAVNKKAGGKPAMSRELTDWKPIGFRLKLTGKVKEIESELIEKPIYDYGKFKKNY